MKTIMLLSEADLGVDRTAGGKIGIANLAPEILKIEPQFDVIAFRCDDKLILLKNRFSSTSSFRTDQELNLLLNELA